MPIFTTAQELTDEIGSHLAAAQAPSPDLTQLEIDLSRTVAQIKGIRTTAASLSALHTAIDALDTQVQAILSGGSGRVVRQLPLLIHHLRESTNCGR